VYNALALPHFLCRSEVWTLRKKDKKRLASIKMEFFRKILGYTLFDHRRKEGILKGMEVERNVKLRTIHIKLATTCKKNEQQGAKNNAEL